MAVPNNYASCKNRENLYVDILRGKSGDRFGKVHTGVAGV
jgi:hypothetical protein